MRTSTTNGGLRQTTWWQNNNENRRWRWQWQQEENRSISRRRTGNETTATKTSTTKGRLHQQTNSRLAPHKNETTATTTRGRDPPSARRRMIDEATVTRRMGRDPTALSTPHGRRSHGDDEFLLDCSAPPRRRWCPPPDDSPSEITTKRASFTSSQGIKVQRTCGVEAKNPSSIPAGDDYGYRPQRRCLERRKKKHQKKRQRPRGFFLSSLGCFVPLVLHFVIRHAPSLLLPWLCEWVLPILSFTRSSSPQNPPIQVLVTVSSHRPKILFMPPLAFRSPRLGWTKLQDEGPTSAPAPPLAVAAP